jgi:hypothetical protein
MEWNFSRKDAAFRYAVRTFIAENYQMAKAISAISELSKATREDTKVRNGLVYRIYAHHETATIVRSAHAA